MSKEKQIEEMENDLRYCHTEYVGDYSDIYTDYYKTAEKLTFMGYRKQSEPFSCGHEKGGEWISVEDRLPEKTCECLIVDTLGVIYLAPYSSRYRAFNATDEDDGDRWRLNNTTHWMPLPEAPKMRKEDEGK